MIDLFLVVGLGVLIYMFTQAIKTITDVAMGKDAEGIPKRKKNVWLNRVVFPAIGPVIGALLGAFVPMRPPLLISFVEEFLSAGTLTTLLYAGYGAVVGQFSKSLYMDAKKFFSEIRLKTSA
jgi:hypothetical protein